MITSDGKTIENSRGERQKFPRRIRPVQKKDQFHHQILYKRKLNNPRLQSQIIKRSEVLKAKIQNEFDFDKNIVDANTLGMFTKTSKFNKNMSKLSLKEDCCDQITSQRFLILWKTLKNLCCLHELQLKFEGPDITDTDKRMGELSSCLNDLPLLQKLSLAFFDCDEMTKKGFHHLSKGFKKLRALRNLTLDFSCCDKLVTDDKLKEISQAFERMSSLRNIDLLLRFSRVTDNGLEDLGKSMSRLELDELSIDCSYVKTITDEGVKKFREYLKKIISLKEVYLTFAHSRQISSESVYLISEAFKSLPLIKDIRLDFQACGEIEDGEWSGSSEGPEDSEISEGSEQIAEESNHQSDSKENESCEEVDKMESFGDSDDEQVDKTDSLSDSDIKEVKEMESFDYSQLPRDFMGATMYVQKELDAIPNVKFVEVFWEPAMNKGYDSSEKDPWTIQIEFRPEFQIIMKNNL